MVETEARKKELTNLNEVMDMMDKDVLTEKREPSSD